MIKNQYSSILPQIKIVRKDAPPSESYLNRLVHLQIISKLNKIKKEQAIDVICKTTEDARRRRGNLISAMERANIRITTTLIGNIIRVWKV